MSELKNQNKNHTQTTTEQNVSTNSVDKNNLSKEEKLYRLKEDYESDAFKNT